MITIGLDLVQIEMVYDSLPSRTESLLLIITFVNINRDSKCLIEAHSETRTSFCDQKFLSDGCYQDDPNHD